MTIEKQIYDILLRLAPLPLFNIGAHFGQVGSGHARFRPLATCERFCQSQLNFQYRGRGVANMQSYKTRAIFIPSH